CHPYRRFAGTGTLQHVAQILELILQPAVQIRMAWPGTMDAAQFLLRPYHRLHIHHLAPVLPVLILYDNRYGSPRRPAVSHTADDLRCILLDLHASAPAIAKLATMQLIV